MLNHKNHFTMEDKIIVDGNLYGQFFKLSSKACTYTQNMTNLYIEKELWKPMLKNQFQIEGYATYPEPHCTTLPIPPNTTRENEVLLMSLFYKNNIMNDSLYKISKVPSQLCSLCNQEEETAEHIIFKCAAVNKNLREDADRKYRIYHNLEPAINIQPDFIDF